MQCDWIGVHCYWLDDAGMLADADGGHYRAYKNEGKPLIISEFSNPGPQPKARRANNTSDTMPACLITSSGPTHLFQARIIQLLHARPGPELRFQRLSGVYQWQLQIIVVIATLTIALGWILDNWKRFGFVLSLMLAWFVAIVLLAIVFCSG